MKIFQSKKKDPKDDDIRIGDLIGEPVDREELATEE
jgi:hypothetical protein